MYYTSDGPCLSSPAGEKVPGYAPTAPGTGKPRHGNNRVADASPRNFNLLIGLVNIERHFAHEVAWPVFRNASTFVPTEGETGGEKSKHSMENLQSFAVNASLVVLGLSFFLTMIRVVIGPTTPDRVVALDLISSLVIGFISVFCIHVNAKIYLNATIVLALVSFLSVIAIARYVERPRQEHLDNREDDDG